MYLNKGEYSTYVSMYCMGLGFIMQLYVPDFSIIKIITQLLTLITVKLN